MILCAMSLPTGAQNALNGNGDEIIGEYFADRGGKKSKVRVTKAADGTYTAQVFWVENPYDEKGNKRKDVKNRDKALRNVDIDKVVLFKGLKYYPKDKEWGGTKIYDPTRGMLINMAAEFVSKDELKLRAKVIGGLGPTIYWEKQK